MSRKRLKQYLLLLMAIGVIAIAMTGGTFATFSASTTNPGNTFVTGTLFMHNSVNGGTACTSESVTTGPNYNSNTGCTVLFSGMSLQGGAQTVHLALTNSGTVPSSDLLFKVANCTVGDNFASTGSHVTFGSGPGCGNLYLTIQETQSNYTTNVYCAYGPATAQPACDAPTSASTLANSTSNTNLKTTAGANATLTAGQTRYYVITVAPGGITNDNTLQNRAVSFDMNWLIDQ
jgi:predicted ribosomally synthesized peptide with SipW-like signal peptide